MRVQIPVKTPSGDITIVEIDSTDSLQDINKKLQIDLKIENLSLTFNGKPFESTKELCNFGMRNQGSSIDISIKKEEFKKERIEIFISTNISTEIVSLYIDNSDKIIQIKEKIKDIKGIPIADQSFWFKEVELTDNATLASYNIVNGTTLTVVLPKQQKKGKDKGCVVM